MKRYHYNVGKNNPMYGKKHEPDTILKMRLIKLGENNPYWKGYDAKIHIVALHNYIRNNSTQPEKCQICNDKKPYDLANMTGIYNRDFENWKYLCRSCHMKLDGRLERLHVRRKVNDY